MTQLTLSPSGTRFCTRPQFIDAVFWTGANIDAVSKVLGHKWMDWDKIHGLYIHTLNGTQHVDVGNWVCIAGAGQRPFTLTNTEFESKYKPA